MITWALTIDTADHFGTVIGVAASPDHARRLLDQATRAAITNNAARRCRSLPRYSMVIDGQPGAVIQTGPDDDGRPDHAGAWELLDRMAAPSPCPFDDDGHPLP